MKTKAFKSLIALASAVLLMFVCCVCATAEAYQWSKTPSSPAYPNVVGAWSGLGSVIKTEQTAHCFIVTVKAGEKEEQLYLSLPTAGGFRLQSKHEYQATLTTSNVGLFEAENATITYKQDANGVVVINGKDGTNLKFQKTADGFTLDICNKTGKKLIGISNKQIFFAYNYKNEVVKTRVELPLTDGEGIYQGGERFNSTNQVGKYTSLTNSDAWSAEDSSYHNVPLFHSNRGYSIWFNMTYPGEADMGWSNKNKYSIQFDGEKLDFYLWVGTPLENIKKYTDITGTSGMYNEWTFGFWSGAMSRAFDETREKNAMKNLVSLLEGYKDNYNFYPEVMYGEGQNSQQQTNIQYQKERGIRTAFWFEPKSDVTSMQNYLPGINRLPDSKAGTTGYPYKFITFALEKYGVYQNTSSQWYDFSNPSVVDVIRARMADIWHFGVSGAMIDYGEYLGFDGSCFNGLSGMEMHNLNSYYYAKNAEKAWQEQWKGDYVLFQRSGTAGTQKFVGQFFGDQSSDWTGYQKQIYAMVSLGASGCNLYGGDYCGLGGRAENNLMSRWTVLSTFSPWMRQHGANIHKPWEQGEANKQNFGKYYYFRKNIVPTIMSAAMDANKTANPIVKGMMVAYPYQLKLVDVSNQYLFCDDFLVCAVTSGNQHSLDVVLPNGDTWYSLFTYGRYKGGQTVAVDAPTAFMPVFIKDGAVKAIDLPESMTLAAEMHDADDVDAEEIYEPHDALLITPPDQERTSVIHVLDGNVTDFRTYKSHSEQYTSKPVNDATFTLTNKEGSDRTIVLALGVTASEIKYDGKTLERLDHMPDYFQEEYGYYVELSGLTTMYLPAGWKEISIVKGDAAYESYKLLSTDVKAVEKMLDTDVKTFYSLPHGTDNETVVELDYDEPQKIGRIVTKWAANYYNTYDIEYSVDGEEWSLITQNPEDEHTVTNGAGSFDVISVDEVEAQYLRIVGIQQAREVDAEVLGNIGIYSFEVYAPDDFVPLAKDDEELPVYDEEDFEDVWEDFNEESDEDVEGEVDGKPNKKPVKKKKIVYDDIPTWVIILCVAGGVIVITGITLLILLLSKKRKKVIAEAINKQNEADISLEY